MVSQHVIMKKKGFISLLLLLWINQWHLLVFHPELWDHSSLLCQFNLVHTSFKLSLCFALIFFFIVMTFKQYNLKGVPYLCCVFFIAVNRFLMKSELKSQLVESKWLSYLQVEFLEVSRLAAKPDFSMYFYTLEIYISYELYIPAQHWNWAEDVQLFSMRNPEKKSLNWEKLFKIKTVCTCSAFLGRWLKFGEFCSSIFLYIQHECKQSFNLHQNFPCGHWCLYQNKKQCQNHSLLTNIFFIFDFFFFCFYRES